MSKRLRRSHRRKLYKRPGFYGLLAAIAFSCLGIYWLLRFRFLPTLFLILAVLMNFLFLLLVWYLLVYRHRKWMKVLGFILAGCIIVANSIESYYLYTTYSALERMNTDEHQSGDYVELYVLKNSVIDEASQLSGRTIGVLRNMNADQRALMIDWLDEQEIDYQLREYDSSLEMARNLKGAAIDAIILYQPYLSVIEGYEGLENFDRDIRSLHQIPCESESLGTADSVDVTKTPFTVLISGIDTYGDIGTSGRSDVNLLVTVNPVSRQIMLISIPRDYYVEMVCDEGTACPAGQRDKLTHTGIFGIQTTEKTLEKVFDTTINYDVRVNFSTVIKVIDELGGVEVNNPNDFSVGNFNFTPGTITLNGEQALAFSRERYSFAAGDRERGRNQMRVVEGIINKALSPQILANYTGILNAVSDSIQMNITPDDIAALVNMQLSKPSSWQIYSYSVTGSDAHEFAPALGDQAYVMIPNEDTVKNARLDIQAVKNGEKPLYSS